MLGIIITSIFQSSSAINGIIVSLAHNNIIKLPVAVAISLGSNVGTCITAFWASLTSNTTSKKLALGHFLFNIIGVILILIIYDFFIVIIKFTSNNLFRQIANAHTLFNLINVVFLLPFLNTFVSFLKGE